MDYFDVFDWYSKIELITSSRLKSVEVLLQSTKRKIHFMCVVCGQKIYVIV